MVRLNPTTQQNVVTYNVVINVDNKDGILLPGMTAQVSIVTNRKERVLRVPSAALRFRPPETDAAAAAAAAPPEKGRRASAQVPRVHVIGESGALTPKEITVGITDGRFTEVLEGLAEGDEVVVRAVAAPTNNQTSGFRFRMF
jgi:HlyD family secretion protein